MTSEKGRITSPGYPGNYSKSVDTQCFVKGAPGTNVTLSFSDLDLESSKVKDGLSGTALSFKF